MILLCRLEMDTAQEGVAPFERSTAVRSKDQRNESSCSLSFCLFKKWVLPERLV
jgi:hypothetical protein